MKRSSMMAAAALALVAGMARAQDPVPLQVGDTAPDFSLQAATREGVQPAPLKLSDLRDQTVVIAFFYKARTSG